MSFLSSHTLHFTPLTPVHIGCNETYEPTNYVIEGTALYEFDPDTAIKNLPDVARKELLKIVSGKPNEEMLKQVQALFYQNRESLIVGAEHFFPVGDGVADLYRKRVGKAAQYEGRGKQVINNLEIERTSYNRANRKPMFPGSSIKGSIRTALLDSINQGESLPYDLKQKRGAAQNRGLQEGLFAGRFHTDPMRLLSVSDAHWAVDGEIPGNEIRFAVNRKRRLKEGERLQQSMAEEKGLSQTLECVTAMQSRCISGSLNIQDVSGLSGSHQKLPSSDKQWTVNEIASKCNRFYMKLFQQESEAMRKMGYLDDQWLSLISTIFSEKTQSKLENNEAFLLRVGRHSGAEALTLEGVRSIKIMGGKNGKPRWQDAPQTWWLASTDKEHSLGMMPFGWVLVEIDAVVSELINGSDEMLSFNASKSAWLKENQTHKNSLKEALEKRLCEEQERLRLVEIKRADDEAKERYEQERLEAEQAQQELELAKLNPVEREVAEFVTYLDAITALTSGNWTADTQSEAAAYIRDRMKTEKVWREQSSKKNPLKDKPFARTKVVQKYLG